MKVLHVEVLILMMTFVCMQDTKKEKHIIDVELGNWKIKEQTKKRQ